MLRQIEGYAGYLALIDAQNSVAKAIVLWQSREAAEAAEEQLAERRKQMTQRMGLTIKSVDLYEAPIVELETVHA